MQFGGNRCEVCFRTALGNAQVPGTMCQCVLINPPVSTVVSLGAGSIQFAKGFGDGVLLFLYERASDCLPLVRRRLWFRQCASLTLCCCDLNTSDNHCKGGGLCFSHTSSGF